MMAQILGILVETLISLKSRADTKWLKIPVNRTSFFVWELFKEGAFFFILEFKEKGT